MLSEAHSAGSIVGEPVGEDLSREVYCILGMPIDVIDMASVLRRIECAAASSSPLFLSTPNLNFLVHSYSDMEFRDSLLLSDLAPADGMPIVWLGRLLGVPIRERVAGSDIFAALKALRRPEQPLKLFLFGGDEGVAAAASHALNAGKSGVVCVGWHFPGFLPVEELSKDFVIEAVNSVDFDFLVVCLGSKKGQLWLKRNSDSLRVPIRAHLGASLNFEAGAVQRAPVIMRKFGLEWLWRIKEEPYLWRRYWHDGQVLLRLLFSQVLPLVIYRLRTSRLSRAQVTLDTERQDGCVKLKFGGAATSNNIKEIVTAFRTALSEANHKVNHIVIDLAGVSAIDFRFLGALLVFRKMVKFNNAELRLTGVSSNLERIFRLNGVGFLVAPSDKRVETNPLSGYAKSSPA